MTAFEFSFLKNTKAESSSDDRRWVTNSPHRLFTCMKTKTELEREPEPQPKSCPWWCYFNRRDLWMKDNMIDFYLCCWFEASSEGHTLVSPFSLMNIQHFVVIICCWHSNYSEYCGCLFGARSVEHRKSHNMWCWRKTLSTHFISWAFVHRFNMFCHFIKLTTQETLIAAVNAKINLLYCPNKQGHLCSFHTSWT